MAGVKELVESKIASSKIMMFSKTKCPSCHSAIKLLKDECERHGLKPSDTIDILQIDRLHEHRVIQNYLQKLTGGRTVPRVFINQKSVGGCDDLFRLRDSGQLTKMLQLY